MTIFLLCDFGKINLKNLQKAKNKLSLIAKDDSFIKASGLEPPITKSFEIHDAISHKYVSPKLQSVVTNKDPSVIYKNNTEFLPLISKNNQFNEIPLRSVEKYNNNLELIVDGIEGRGKRGSKGYRMFQSIGKSIRNKKLSEVDKLMTSNRSYFDLPFIPDKQTVDELIKNNRERAKPKTILAPKQRGVKPIPTTIEEKQLKLKQKYGII